MSFPVFADIDKPITDKFDDDYDLKTAFKVKTAGPWGTTVTTNTTLNCKDKSTSTKVAIKYPHPSGFTLDKLEITNDGYMVTETSLAGLTKGLKLEFKGNDQKGTGDVTATFVHPKVTVTGELDVLGLNQIKVSATGGNGPVTVGASTVLKTSGGAPEKINVAVGYTAPKFYGVVKACDFKDFSGLVTYSVNEKLNVAATVTHGEKGVGGAAAAIYACCPNNTVRVKADTCGTITASVKRNYEKRFTVVAAAQTTTAFKDFKWGLTATLG